MRMKTTRRLAAAMVATVGLTAAGGCSVFGIRTTEEPAFEVIASDEEADVEIRRYGEVLVATTEVEGSFEEGGNAGFRPRRCSWRAPPAPTPTGAAGGSCRS